MNARRVSWLAGGLVAAVLTALAVTGPAARAEEKAKRITFEKAPKAVRDAILARFPNATVSSIEKENENGKVVFDVELKHQGRKYEMDIQEDGTILEIEKEIPAADVPEAVRKAIETKYPKSTVKEVMEVSKVQGKQETPVHYEADIVTAAGKKMEVIVSLDGKNVKTEGEEKNEKQ